MKHNFLNRKSKLSSFGGANTYKNNSIKTASREKILIMLFDGAIKFLNEAKEAINVGNIAKKGEKICRALAIVHEFQNALNYNLDEELCGELHTLYNFVADELTEANLKSDIDKIEGCISILDTLRQGFKVAVKDVQENGYEK